MPVKDAPESREFPRLLLNRMVIVKKPSGEVQKLIGMNYSDGGMALNSQMPMSSGEFVHLQFWLTEPDTKEVNIAAEVLHFSKQGNVYTNSLKFIAELSAN